MSAEWKQIGGIEVCEGTDGVVGVIWGMGLLSQIHPDGRPVRGYESFLSRGDAKAHFERAHCQPRHRLIECADGAVMVLSVDDVDGKPRRGAMLSPGACDAWWCETGNGDGEFKKSKDEAIAAAVAYVTAR